ncbi:MAG: hypothetical protein V3V99_07370 [candidate division Zixibacteria bacterium]
MKVMVKLSLVLFLFVLTGNIYAQETIIMEENVQEAAKAFAEAHPGAVLVNFENGARQVAQLWRDRDGTSDEYVKFCLDNFIVDEEQRRLTALRYQDALASIYGHLWQMGRELGWHLTIDTGPLLPIDYEFAKFSPGSHINDDLFESKLAFIVLLNYPDYNLEELLDEGSDFSREEWVFARLGSRFSSRVPADISKNLSKVFVEADSYIGAYNIFMHHLLTSDGQRLFPHGMRLVSHWNLRDELKARYANPNGLVNQEMVFDVMLKIINQEIPQAVINNPAVDWNLSSNEVTISSIIDGDIPNSWTQEGNPGDKFDNSPEPNTRYRHLLNIFNGQKDADKYNPKWPTLMDRRFKRDREMLEGNVEILFETVLTSEVLQDIGRLIEKRLGRKLRPFDIWYDGFKARSSFDGRKLDSIVKDKYPNAEALQADFPNILIQLGFEKNVAADIALKIAVDPARGIGHASGPPYRGEKARLRTRVGKSGIDYKGFNIAIHEFGHNVEQVISLYMVDHTLLRGVPNTAFTESFAFIFQTRDLELLGVDIDNPDAHNLYVLDETWGAMEICAVSLLDMRIWRWMYEHPDATPEELKLAVVSIARDIWNQYFSPVFGIKDCEILAIYSHIIDNALYLPNYAIGSMIAYQIEDYMKDKVIGEEMVRMCKIGSVTPDLWMQQAVGQPISPQPLLDAAKLAVKQISD